MGGYSLSFFMGSNWKWADWSKALVKGGQEEDARQARSRPRREGREEKARGEGQATRQSAIARASCREEVKSALCFHLHLHFFDEFG